MYWSVQSLNEKGSTVRKVGWVNGLLAEAVTVVFSYPKWPVKNFAFIELNICLQLASYSIFGFELKQKEKHNSATIFNFRFRYFVRKFTWRGTERRLTALGNNRNSLIIKNPTIHWFKNSKCLEVMFSKQNASERTSYHYIFRFYIYNMQ